MVPVNRPIPNPGRDLHLTLIEGVFHDHPRSSTSMEAPILACILAWHNLLLLLCSTHHSIWIGGTNFAFMESEVKQGGWFLSIDLYLTLIVPTLQGNWRILCMCPPRCLKKIEIWYHQSVEESSWLELVRRPLVKFWFLGTYLERNPRVAWGFWRLQHKNDDIGTGVRASTNPIKVYMTCHNIGPRAQGFRYALTLA